MEENKNEEIQNIESKLKEFEDNYINNESMSVNTNANIGFYQTRQNFPS